MQSWLPALDGVTAKLERGATVADVGCGHGFSTIIMAKAFPRSTFVGYDFHAGSIEQARAHAEQHGVTANTQFEVASASDFPGQDLDLVTFFDCLHDMGDPIGAARHVRQTLKPDGRWMIVEPQAGDRLEDNLNPVSRLFFAASTMICVPTSLDQPVGAAFGAQAGLARLTSAITEGGFAHVSKATETPFNMIWRRGPKLRAHSPARRADFQGGRSQAERSGRSCANPRWPARRGDLGRCNRTDRSRKRGRPGPSF